MAMTTEDQLQVAESKIVELTTLLSQALTRISELEALVLKLSTKKTSSNSSKPPSSDIARKNQSLRPKSDKPAGGQKGHQGHTLKMSETPDIKEELRPDFCSNCGVSLAGAPFELVARRQVIDIPPIVPITTEYQSLGTVCTCGHHACGSFPEGVTNHVQYGKNLQSLVIYQSYFQFLPFARLQDFFKKACNLSIGKGTIENIIRRAAQKAEPAYQQIQKTVVLSFFVGSDETSFKVKGAKHWFWVWQTALLTYIVAATSRSKQVIKDCFPDGLPNSILGSDRLAAQLSTISKGNQVCLAHLLRELNYLIQAEKHEWATAFKTLLQDAIKLKQGKTDYTQNDPLVQKIEARAGLLLATAMRDEQMKDKVAYQQTITFFNGMIKVRHALFPCLYHHLVPFDNNSSERAFRMVKVKTKISGQFKSLQHEFAVIRSVIDTAIKNGNAAFDAIRAIVDMPIPKKTAG
jgi:transposase